jgi:hypothetical protein
VGQRAKTQQQVVINAKAPVFPADLIQRFADVINSVHQEHTACLGLLRRILPSFFEQRCHSADQAVIQLHQQVI